MKLVLLTILVAYSSAATINTDVDAKLSAFDGITDEYVELLNSVEGTWTAGHNFPKDTKFEVLNVLSGAIRGKLPAQKNLDLPDDFEIPESFDSRTNWPKCKSIKEIKNQGHCGSCWAVSSATTISDRLCIATKGKFNTDISAQNIVSCSSGSGGCHGGQPSDAWQYYVDSGAPTGGDYHSNQGCQPYLVEPCINRTGSNGHPMQCPSTDYVKTPACKNTCYNKKYHSTYSKDLHHGKLVYSVSDVKSIQADIMKHGPVVGIFIVYCDFYAYKTGIYQHKTDQYCGLHAIRIIGWGVEDGTDYWLITNQWGKEWGDNGTVKFLKGTNECHIEDNVIAGIP